jgi:hypothetical protein
MCLSLRAQRGNLPQASRENARDLDEIATLTRPLDKDYFVTSFLAMT